MTFRKRGDPPRGGGSTNLFGMEIAFSQAFFAFKRATCLSKLKTFPEWESGPLLYFAMHLQFPNAFSIFGMRHGP